jgi:phage baseplate assembly protein W
MGIASQYLAVDLANNNQGIIYDTDAFINKIMNIISTPINTFPFYRNFGTGIEKLLFKPLSYTNSVLIATEIENEILRYYPDAKAVVIIGDIDYSNRIYPMTINITSPWAINPILINQNYQSYV